MARENGKYVENMQTDWAEGKEHHVFLPIDCLYVCSCQLVAYSLPVPASELPIHCMFPVNELPVHCLL
jgi:hypothetical protein